MKARAVLVAEARQQVEKEMARLRVQQAVRHNVPRAADTNYKIGQQLLVWREKQVANRIVEWIGPLTVTAVQRD